MIEREVRTALARMKPEVDDSTGLPRRAERIQELYLAGRKEEAVAAVPMS